MYNLEIIFKNGEEQTVIVDEKGKVGWLKLVKQLYAEGQITGWGIEPNLSYPSARV